MATTIKSAVTERQTDPILRVKDGGSISTLESPGLGAAVGIIEPDTDVSIITSGTIDGFTGIAISKAEASFSIRNSGEIIANDILIELGEPGSLQYELISVPTAAVEVSFGKNFDGTGLLRNDGTITPPGGFIDIDGFDGSAVLATDGEITIVNTGSILGPVNILGSGEDRLFTTEGSEITGTVNFYDSSVFIKHGGSATGVRTSDQADKVAITSTGDVRSLSTGEGDDSVFNQGSLGGANLGDGDDRYKASGSSSAQTVEAGEGNDTLRGGSANDGLDGEAGDDVLIGGQGDDILRPGEGTDKLIFRPGDGNDSIKRFSTDDGDTLVLKAHGFESFEELQDQISIVDGSTLIDLGDDSILLLGFQRQLEADDVVL